MFFSVCTVLCLIGVVVLLPFYLKMIKPGHTLKTLVMKGALSALFVGIAFFSAFGLGHPQTLFSKLMLCAFILSFIGDLLLHRDKGMPKYVAGGVGFLAAHVCFIVAFISAAKKLVPNQPFMTTGQILALLILWAAVVALFIAFKPNFKKLAPVIFLYAAILMFMVVKAGYLGYLITAACLPNSSRAMVLLSAGAGLFAFSDAVLGISFFTKPTYGKKAVNVVAYYCGQVLLALSLAAVSV